MKECSLSADSGSKPERGESHVSSYALGNGQEAAAPAAPQQTPASPLESSLRGLPEGRSPSPAKRQFSMERVLNKMRQSGISAPPEDVLVDRPPAELSAIEATVKATTVALDCDTGD